MSLKILTFNWHESYIHLLAKTGYDFDVVEKEKAGIRGWIRAIRPVPENCSLVTEAEAGARLYTGTYDRIIAHNLGDLLSVQGVETPKVLVFHNKLTTEIALSKDPVDRSEYLERVSRLFTETSNLSLVFISQAKMEDWGFNGELILPGIDEDDYGAYSGEDERVLRVGNGLRERDVMLGYSVQERVCNGLPSTILGLNALLPHAYVPKDWDEYRAFLRGHRVYLNTTVEPFEDGYNLAMLEAMATGMPVVSTHSRTSPIDHGVSGYVSKDEAELRAALETLLKDRPLAASMGGRAREKVLDRFPIRRFVDHWRAVLGDEPVRRSLAVRTGTRAGCKILMSYTSNPLTTATYLEKALRRRHEVITYGPCIQEDVLKLWDMEEIRGRVKEHDIPYFTKDMTEVFDHLPKGWKPDFFLWVESGIHYPMERVESLPCPTACYLVDTHLNWDKHLEIARRFDCAFVAQKEYVPRFKASGIEQVNWLPLACDPEVHRKFGEDKDFDVCFVGSITPLNRRRNGLLVRLAERFSLHVDRCFLEEMARTFSRSKIVFNGSVKNDLNMRVFEALATGSLLVTDDAKGSGLTDLFQDRRHLVLYRNEAELYERVEHYLKNPREREAIALEGMREVISRHTYEHRAARLVDVMGRLEATRLQPERRPIVTPIEAETDSATLRDYYKKERRELAVLIPEAAEKILDIGCGGGHLGRFLKSQMKGREIWGVEINTDACQEARKWLDHVRCEDACAWEPPVGDGYFDVLVFADILEHLLDPKATLEHYLRWLKPTGSVVMSIPNVRYWGLVKNLVDGYWTYEDEGLLDRDHVRFFTWTEVERLLASCGLECGEVRSNLDRRCPDVPDGKAIDLRLGRITLHDLEPDELRQFFTFQYLVRGVRTRKHLLGEAERMEVEGRGPEAFRLYASLLDRDGVDTRAAGRLAEIGTTAEEKREASALIDKCLHVHPANIDLLLASAQLLSAEQRLEEARQRLERVLLFVPEHGEARARLDRLSC